MNADFVSSMQMPSFFFIWSGNERRAQPHTQNLLCFGPILGLDSLESINAGMTLSNDWPIMIETALRNSSLVLTNYSPTRKKGRY